jgi:hypothetical protein
MMLVCDINSSSVPCLMKIATTFRGLPTLSALVLCTVKIKFWNCPCFCKEKSKEVKAWDCETYMNILAWKSEGKLLLETHRRSWKYHVKMLLKCTGLERDSCVHSARKCASSECLELCNETPRFIKEVNFSIRQQLLGYLLTPWRYSPNGHKPPLIRFHSLI